MIYTSAFYSNFFIIELWSILYFDGAYQHLLVRFLKKGLSKSTDLIKFNFTVMKLDKNRNSLKKLQICVITFDSGSRNVIYDCGSKV